MLETRTGGERVYSGRVLNLDLDQIRLADGRESVREVIRHPGAVLIVPLLADGRVVLIRQHRYTAGRELWELPAGGLNPDDPDHLAAARRELAEETGYRADHWQPLTHFYTTPGFTDEVIYCFLATGLTADAVAEGDEDEAIEVVIKPLAEALDMVRDGTIEDAKTMVALLLAADRR